MSYTFYAIVVEKPDGSDGWTEVYRTHTDGATDDRNAMGIGATDALLSFFKYRWPVRPAGVWNVEWQQAVVAMANHRLTATPTSRFDDPSDTVTMTVADLLLTELRARAAEKTKAQADLKTALAELAKARKEVLQRRSVARCAGYDIEHYERVCAAAGIDPKLVAAAKRTPRRPRSEKKP